MKITALFLSILMIISVLLTGCGEVAENAEDETTVEDTTAETTSNVELSFELIAGEQGDYGKLITYNAGTEFEENIYGYYVPSGNYTVTNLGNYLTQINVLEKGKNIVDGWEEGIVVEVFVLPANQSKTFTVPEGCHIEIAEPTHILMEKAK